MNPLKRKQLAIMASKRFKAVKLRSVENTPLTLNRTVEGNLLSYEIRGNIYRKSSPIWRSPQYPVFLGDGKNLLSENQNLTFTQHLWKSVNIPKGIYKLQVDSITVDDEERYDMLYVRFDNSKYGFKVQKGYTLVPVTRDETGIRFYANDFNYPGSAGHTPSIKGLVFSNLYDSVDGSSFTIPFSVKNTDGTRERYIAANIPEQLITLTTSSSSAYVDKLVLNADGTTEEHHYYQKLLFDYSNANWELAGENANGILEFRNKIPFTFGNYEVTGNYAISSHFKFTRQAFEKMNGEGFYIYAADDEDGNTYWNISIYLPKTTIATAEALNNAFNTRMLYVFFLNGIKRVSAPELPNFPTYNGGTYIAADTFINLGGFKCDYMAKYLYGRLKTSTATKNIAKGYAFSINKPCCNEYDEGSGAKGCFRDYKFVGDTVTEGLFEVGSMNAYTSDEPLMGRIYGTGCVKGSDVVPHIIGESITWNTEPLHGFTYGQNECRDTLSYKDGGILRRCKKVILTGEETGWIKSTEYDNTFNLSLNGDILNSSCNYYANMQQSQIGNCAYGIYTEYEKQIFFTDKRFTELTDFKAWLKEKYDKGVPVTLVYASKALSEKPIFEPLDLPKWTYYEDSTIRQLAAPSHEEWENYVFPYEATVEYYSEEK